MPTCRRKRVLLTEPSEELLQAAKHDPNRHVFLLEQTGEIFETYEQYAARMSFYKVKQFQCEVTGKSGLDYFQALESEQHEARELHQRFPEPLKYMVLRSVQWQVMGRLDNLVEAIYARYKDRFFQGERILIDLKGDKYSAKIVKVYPPKIALRSISPAPEWDSSLESDLDSEDESKESSYRWVDPEMPHLLGGDMSISLQDSCYRDDPTKYIYKVQIVEEDPSSEASGSQPSEEAKQKWSGSLMDVQCGVMSCLNQSSRDRMVFSKSLLRRFLRDCVDRESSLAAPWTVKPSIARRFGIANEMPADIKADVEKARQGEIDKRKRVWEEKELQAEREGRLTKKMQKKQEQERKAAVKAAEAEVKAREAEAKAVAVARAKADKVAAEQAAKEEAERIALEKAKQKKKPVRYPTEDLDVRIGDREKKAGMKLQRPLPHRNIDSLPFSDEKGAFESFLATWNFLMCYGQPLHLSTFTLDEYEHALKHNTIDPPCGLIAEVHSVLIYLLRTVPFHRGSAANSLWEEWKQEMDVDGEDDEISNQDLLDALQDVGNNWERVPLKHSEGRIGWEEALVGCLKDHGTIRNFPRMRAIFTHLLYDDEQPGPAARSTSPFGSSPLSSPTARSPRSSVSPADRYHTLHPSDKLAILQFMCDLAVSSKAIHAHMEHCEEQLTSLRKEKIELNRTKKHYAEDMEAIIESTKEKESPEAPTAPTPANEMSDVDSESALPSEDVSEAGSSAGRRASSSSRQLTLRLKAQQTQAIAKQRERNRQLQAEQKQALNEHKRLGEEISKIERRLEVIEREFRKLLGTVRVKPMGRDRFYNRIWWFDGCGSQSLMGSGGVPQYGTGRLFIQGPSEFDQEIIDRRDEGDVEARRVEEEGEAGVMHVGEWAVYSEEEQIDEFLAWLNPKGVREFALKNSLIKWWEAITSGVRKRETDLSWTAKLPEARRSMRGKSSGSDISREPYMLWTNRKAIN
ncbi:hypothetical protein SCHPADRAFT_887277 [Schizopora paradoxa]|uniref:Chromatin remodeling complex protein n=1 Tax=Schizopora paradoxa TaxID=27342 RepID=A0A0H2RZF4_9AGAM|nr:hypothetical protein SCHPADRAFT_887277 [Schizopora paradoxa]